MKTNEKKSEIRDLGYRVAAWRPCDTLRERFGQTIFATFPRHLQCSSGYKESFKPFPREWTTQKEAQNPEDRDNPFQNLQRPLRIHGHGSYQRSEDLGKGRAARVVPRTKSTYKKEVFREESLEEMFIEGTNRPTSPSMTKSGNAADKFGSGDRLRKLSGESVPSVF